MIKIGNLILRAKVLEGFNNSRYVEKCLLLFRKLNMWIFELRIKKLRSYSQSNTMK